MAYVRRGVLGAIGAGYQGLGQLIWREGEGFVSTHATPPPPCSPGWVARGEVCPGISPAAPPPPRRPATRRPPSTTAEEPGKDFGPPSDVEPLTPSGEKNGNGREAILPWWVWLLVGLGAAALLAGGGTALFRGRRRKLSAKSAGAEV